MKFSNTAVTLVISLFATSVSNSAASIVGLRITSAVAKTVCTKDETHLIEQSLRSHLQDTIKNKNSSGIRANSNSMACIAPCASLPSDQLCLSVDSGCDVVVPTEEHHKELVENPPANLEDYCEAACDGLDDIQCESQFPACASTLSSTTERDLQRNNYQCSDWYCRTYCSVYGCACREIYTCCWDFASHKWCDDDAGDDYWYRSRRHLQEEEEDDRLAHSPTVFLSECHVQQQAAVRFLQDNASFQTTTTMHTVSDECRAALQTITVDCIEL